MISSPALTSGVGFDNAPVFGNAAGSPLAKSSGHLSYSGSVFTSGSPLAGYGHYTIIAAQESAAHGRVCGLPAFQEKCGVFDSMFSQASKSPILLTP